MNPAGDVIAAVNRFGLGARPGDFAVISDPRAWLEAQIARGADAGSLFAGLPGSLAYLKREGEYRLQRKGFKQADDLGRRNLLAGSGGTVAAQADGGNAKQRKPQALQEFVHGFRSDMLAEMATRFHLAATTNTPFVERLVHFWSNHFAVSQDKAPARLFVAPMEREAIRPHVTGRFADMLLAVETHPAMLRYLDNVQSIGPDSFAGERITQRLARTGDADKGKSGGLNENLGREIMELHTLGVDGGYTQADVTELARALTGWGTPSPKQFQAGAGGVDAKHDPFAWAGGKAPPRSAFVFRAAAHEPGARTVMGKTYAQAGFDQGRAILQDLARHPATAKHLATQLATHFVSDAPPTALVERMAKSYLDHDTDLAAVYHTLVTSPEAWGADARKFKTPQDFVVSALRAGTIDVGANPAPLLTMLDHLGEPIFTPRSPAGFPDKASYWMDADALWKRVQAAEALSQRVPSASVSPDDLAIQMLGSGLDRETINAIRRAESRQEAMATLFACPAFQWRA